jgi:cbb3-type cytochrome oxidase cytochrome c subunit
MKMTFRLTVIGGVIVFFAVVLGVVFIPKLVWNPPQTLDAHPYTDREALGRETFYSNGCNYCHTQYVRAEDTAMGPVSEGGNYYFDNPMILGSERTGPDLSYVGRKRSEAWEIEHWKNPRQVSPLSIMPSFEFLSDEELNAMASYIFNLGDRVAAMYMILPPEPYALQADLITYPPMSTDSSQPLGWPTWEASELQAGKELYVTRCMTCHGCAGNGLGSYAGTLMVTPADYKQEPFRNMPDEQWFWHVSEGIQGTVMPPWKESMSEQERWQVIRYIQQIFARPVERDPDEGDPPSPYSGMTNPVPLNLETLQEGKAIFIRECRVCHGDAGTGHGPFRQGLLPLPPDFSDGSYGTLQDPSYTDADYFWRISEGLPWSAMPTWKLRYSDDDRWKLVHYLRVNFTQTEAAPPPPSGQDFIFPEIYQSQAMPESASYERGRQIFLQHCAHCHGLAGDGQGWDGQYLNPQPANFHDMNGMEMSQSGQAEHLAKVTFGIEDTAMPTWGESLPVSERWDVINFLMGSFMTGHPVTESVYGNGDVASNFVTLSQDNWLAEGHVISPTEGADLFTTYCMTCHGSDGQGNGPGTENNASQGPSPFTPDMGEPYIMWRIWDGVPESMMPPFQWLLSETDIWNITAHVQQMTQTSSGGG